MVMTGDNRPLFYDYSTPQPNGEDNITKAIKELLNEFPRLSNSDIVEFQNMDATSGKAFYPTNSVAILREVDDITDHVTQTCAYNFLFIYRASGMNEKRRQAVKEWLDSLGRWLEKDTITVDSESYRLEDYPELADSKEFKSFKRQSQAYLYATNDNKVEDWGIMIQALYTNEFDR